MRSDIAGLRGNEVETGRAKTAAADLGAMKARMRRDAGKTTIVVGVLGHAIVGLRHGTAIEIDTVGIEAARKTRMTKRGPTTKATVEKKETRTNKRSQAT